MYGGGGRGDGGEGVGSGEGHRKAYEEECKEGPLDRFGRGQKAKFRTRNPLTSQVPTVLYRVLEPLGPYIVGSWGVRDHSRNRALELEALSGQATKEPESKAQKLPESQACPDP